MIEDMYLLKINEYWIRKDKYINLHTFPLVKIII